MRVKIVRKTNFKGAKIIEKSSKGKIIISSLDHFTVDWFTTLLIPLLPLIATKFSLQAGTAAFIPATLIAISAFLQPFGAFLGERVNAQTIETMGILITAVFMSMIGMTSNLWIFITFLVLANFGNAIFHPNAAGYVGNIPSKKKHTIMSIFSIGGALGRAVSPLIIVGYVDLFGMKNMYFLAMIGIIMAIFTIIYLVPDGVKIKTKKKGEKFVLGQTLRIKGVKPLMLLILLRTLAMRSFFNLVPLYLAFIGLHLVWGGLFLTFSALAGVISNYFGAVLADKLGPKNVNIFSIFVSVPFAFLFMSNSNPYFMLTMYTLMTFFASFGLAFNISYMQDFLPKHKEVASSLSMGLPWGIAGVAFMILSFIVNIVGLYPILFVGGFALLGSAIIALKLPKMDG